MPDSTDFSRIAAFTDGVFAIAITLLVLALEVPVGDAGLTERLLDQWPSLLAYFLSFAVVGRFWIVHHRFFASLHRFDQRLLTLNLAFLAFIALVPFTTDLLGEHGGDTVAVVTYALVMAVVAALNMAMIRHTLARGHVREEHRRHTEPFAGGVAALTPGAFLASIPVAFLSPLAAELMWTGVVLARVGRGLVQRRRDAG